MRKRFGIVTLLLLGALLLTACTRSGETAEDPAEITEETQQNELFGKLNIGGTPTETFQIVRSDYSGKDVTKASLTLRNAMQDALGVTMDRIITTDWHDNAVLQNEIVVGQSTRLAEEDYPETPAELGVKGFFIMERDGKIFIVGGTDEGVTIGVDRFIADFVEGKDAIVMPIGYTYLSYHDYDIQTLTIAGRDIREYSIVIDEAGENEDAAKDFAELIASSAGITLEITKDASVSPAIRMDGADRKSVV